jgi:hypothetical protein
MEDDAHIPRQRLVVTGPQREPLYERFWRLFYGRDDVEVIKDRRQGERRLDAAVAEQDRRTADRRQWSVPRIGPPD